MSTLTISSILVDVGSNMQSILEESLSREAATALEALRRAACTGARSALEDPPPTLLHPSKFGSSSFLYGSVKASPLPDVPYREGRWSVPAECACIGGLIINVAKDACLPCILYAKISDDGKIAELYVFVPNAPIGLCEVELFRGAVDSNNAFERWWVGDELVSQVALRVHVGRYIQACGLQKMPRWLLSGNYHVVRPGPLAFLRLRQPTNDVEAAAVNELLHNVPCPEKGVRGLHDLLSENGCGSNGIKLYTVLQRQRVPESELQMSCAAAAEKPILGALALGILKFASDDDYYDVEEKDAQIMCSEDDKTMCERKDDPLQEILNKLQEDEKTMLVKQLPESMRPSKVHQMSDMFENTLQKVSTKCIGRTAPNGQMCVSVIDALLSKSDADIVKASIEARGGSIEKQLCTIGESLDTRQGILVCIITEDGRIHNITIVGENTNQCNLDLDDTRRIIMHPWLVPIAVTKEHVYRMYIKGVQYEPLRLSEAVRLRRAQRVAPPATPTLPTSPTTVAPPAPVNVDLSTVEPVHECLKSLPELIQQFKALEQEFRALKELEMDKKRREKNECQHSSQPRQCSGHSPQPAPPQQRLSGITLGIRDLPADELPAVVGLKRALAILEAEEAAENRSR